MINDKKLVVIFFTSFSILIFPYILQVLATPEGNLATGYITGGPDYMTFISKMKWGEAGHWSYLNRYTPEPTETVPIYWLYLLLGHLAALLNISLQTVFHVATALFGGVAITLLWFFVNKHTKYPLIAFLFAVFASGGILSSVDTVLNTDLAHLDGFLQGHVYLALRAFPHYAVDLIAILLICHAYLKENLERKHLVLLAFVGGFLVSIIHPFLLALIPLTLIHALVSNRPALKRSVLINISALLSAAPVTLLVGYSILHISWLSEWREQTALDSLPNPLIFLAAIYGLAGVVGWIKALNELGHRRLSLWSVWLLSASFMAYFMPIGNRFEFTFFLSVPLGILSAQWVGKLLDWIKTFRAHKIAKIYVSIVVILLFTWHGLIHVPNTFINSTSGNRYLPKSYVEALKDIDKNSQYGDVVLSTWETGNAIPAYTYNLKPYVGHPLETLNYKEKKDNVDSFFEGNMDESAAQEFLERSRTRWIIYDSTPKEAVDSEILNLLGQPVWEDKSIKIWEVIR